MKITRQELKSLEKVGSGGFGTVYKKDDKAIKIYNRTIKTRAGFGFSKRVNNPCLKFYNINKAVFLRNQLYNLKLNNSKLPTEGVYINGKLNGVSYDFYEGTDLSNAINYDYNLKEKLGLQLIERTKELTDHLIYPLDLKLNNVIASENGTVHIIDLDDILTKITLIPNHHYKKQSLYALKKTLLYFYYSHKQIMPFYFINDLSNPLNDFLLKKRFDYDDLTSFITNEFSPINTIFISEYDLITIDLDYLRNFINQTETKIILLTQNKTYLNQELLLLKEKGINVYDIMQLNGDIKSIANEYTKTHNIIENYEYKGKDKIKKIV